MPDINTQWAASNLTTTLPLAISILLIGAFSALAWVGVISIATAFWLWL